MVAVRKCCAACQHTADVCSVEADVRSIQPPGRHDNHVCEGDGVGCCAAAAGAGAGLTATAIAAAAISGCCRGGRCGCRCHRQPCQQRCRKSQCVRCCLLSR